MNHGSRRLLAAAALRAPPTRPSPASFGSLVATSIERILHTTSSQRDAGTFVSVIAQFKQRHFIFRTCRWAFPPHSLIAATRPFLRSISVTSTRYQSFKARNGEAYNLRACDEPRASGRPKSIVVERIRTVTEGGTPTRVTRTARTLALNKNAAEMLRSALRDIFRRGAYLDPTLIPDIVTAILKDPRAQDNQLCLRALRLMSDPPDTSLADFLVPAIRTLALNYSHNEKNPSFQKWLWLLSKHCSRPVFVDFVKQVFADEITAEVVKLDTKLQWIVRLAKEYEFATLVTVVSTLKEADFADARVMAFFTTMVRVKADAKYPYELTTALSSALLDLGLPPRRDFINALIANAVDTRDTDTAWELFRIGTANGLAGDDFTFSHLAKLIVTSEGDEIVKDTLAEIQKAQAMSGNVAFSILLALYEREAISATVSGRQPQYFDVLSSSYSAVFYLDPLARLCLIDSRQKASVGTRLLQPDEKVLCLMLQAFLQQGLADPERIKRIYSAYLSGVQNSDPVLKVLGKSTVVANLLMLAAAARPDTQPMCGTIMSHLLKSPFAAEQEQFSDLPLRQFNADQLDHWRQKVYDYKTVLKVEKSKQGPPASPTMPHPNQWSWSILLHSFSLHGKTKEAEAILKLMRMEGVKPDHVSYKTLLHGYVRTQDSGGAVDVLERMENELVPIDDSVLSSLGKLKDNRKLQLALEASLQRRKAAQMDTEQKLIFDDTEPSGVTQTSRGQQVLNTIPTKVDIGHVSISEDNSFSEAEHSDQTQQTVRWSPASS